MMGEMVVFTIQNLYKIHFDLIQGFPSVACRQFSCTAQILHGGAFCSRLFQTRKAKIRGIDVERCSEINDKISVVTPPIYAEAILNNLYHPNRISYGPCLPS